MQNLPPVTTQNKGLMPVLLPLNKFPNLCMDYAKPQASEEVK